MSLPIEPLATGSVTIAGESVPIASLSRADVIRLAGMGDNPEDAETLMIAHGTGVSDDEARAWRTKVDAKTAERLLDAVAVLSGIRTAKPGKA